MAAAATASKKAGGRRSAEVVTRVYETLRERAINYQLRPSERINELQLAQELEVSRTPIREALNRLISEGMITFVPNRGFYRTPLDIKEICNIFEARRAIEVAAVRLACARGSDAAIAGLGRAWADAEARYGALPPDEMARRDEAFHETLVALSGNEEMVSLLRGLNARIRFVRSLALESERYAPKAAAADEPGEALAEHRLIAEALAARDADRCAELLERHITLTLDDAVVLLKEGLGRIYMPQLDAEALPD